MKLARPWWLILGATAGVLVLVVGLSQGLKQLTAEQLRGQLETISDSQVPLWIGHAVRLDLEGIPLLVEALGSRRETVARAAHKALEQQIHSWQFQPWPQVSRKLATLADALAAQVGDFGPTARAQAAKLARRILRWPTDPQAVDNQRLITACREVLRVGSAVGGWPSTPPSPAGSPPVDLPSHRDGLRLGQDIPLHSGAAAIARNHLPGGGLPISPADQDADRPSSSSQPTDEIPEPWAEAAPGQGETPTEQNEALPSASSEAPRLLPVSKTASRITESERSTSRQPRSSDHYFSSPPELSDGQLRKLPTLELIRRLQAADALVVGRAQAELVRRGFHPAHLELARQLVHPDPAVRQQLVRRLPQQPGIDPTVWLLWMAQDADAEVRLAALGLLATSGDPRLLRQIEQMARADPDPRIQQQAVRLAEQRRMPAR